MTAGDSFFDICRLTNDDLVTTIIKGRWLLMFKRLSLLQEVTPGTKFHGGKEVGL